MGAETKRDSGTQPPAHNAGRNQLSPFSQTLPTVSDKFIPYKGSVNSESQTSGAVPPLTLIAQGPVPRKAEIIQPDRFQKIGDEVRDILTGIPGTVDADLWDWSKRYIGPDSTASKRGSAIIVPRKKGNAEPLYIMGQGQVSETCGLGKQTFACGDFVTGNIYLSVPPINRKDLPFLRKITPQDQRVMFRARTDHELTHLLGGGEFSAHTNEFKTMSDNGLIKPMSRDNTLAFILANYPLPVYVESLLEAFHWRQAREKGISTLPVEAKKLMPGGQNFNAIYNEALSYLNQAATRTNSDLGTSTISEFKLKCAPVLENNIDALMSIVISGTTQYFKREYLVMELNKQKGDHNKLAEAEANWQKLGTNSSNPLYNYISEHLILTAKSSLGFK